MPTVNRILRVPIGDPPTALDAVVAAPGRFLSAALPPRFSPGRPPRNSPFGRLAAVAAGPRAERVATATDTSRPGEATTATRTLTAVIWPSARPLRCGR